MRSAKHIVAMCALLFTAGCAALGASEPVVGTAVPEPAPPPHIAQVDMLTFGGTHRFGTGLSAEVSTPRQFQPSATAYPTAPRGVAFEITIRNDGTRPYRLSGLAVAATVAGQPVRQIVDPPQGYTGITNAGKDIPPSRHSRFTLAFAMPSEPVELSLTLRPDARGPQLATYIGPA